MLLNENILNKYKYTIKYKCEIPYDNPKNILSQYSTHVSEWSKYVLLNK